MSPFPVNPRWYDEYWMTERRPRLLRLAAALRRLRASSLSKRLFRQHRSKNGNARCEHLTSEMPATADIGRTSASGSFVPKTEMLAASI